MKLLVATMLLLVSLGSTPAWADDHPKPKGNDTGCCFSFDNSPVNLVFCTQPDSCRFASPPKEGLR